MIEHLDVIALENAVCTALHKTMNPIIVETVGEIARKGNVSDETLRRHIKAAGNIVPCVLIRMSRRDIPAFVPARAAELLALCADPKIKA